MQAMWQKVFLFPMRAPFQWLTLTKPSAVQTKQSRTRRDWSFSFLSLIKAMVGLTLAASWSLQAEAQQAYDESWAEINQYSPVENFQSRGSYGWHIGIGMVQTAAASPPSTSDALSSDAGDTKPLRVPRLIMSKGTPWPIDFGLSLARRPENEKAWQYGGHLQWTLWEAFRLPTLALRMSRLETTGIETLPLLRTDSIQIGSSYAPFNMITLSASVGLQWQSRDWQQDLDGLTLTTIEEDIQRRQYQVYTWGVRIQPFSPFVSLGFEQVRWGQTHLVHHLQLAVLL